MEQALYWMHTKRKHILNSHIQSSTNIPSYGDSWEEQAFAEDAAGPLGGCIWPPRSYSCSFCKREFRSAQALGGHMNVHRRDRARLKQSPNPHTSEIQIPHLHHQNQHTNLPNSCSSLDVQYPPQISILDYNPNPSSDHCVLASTSSPSWLSAPSLVDNCSDQNNLVLPFSSPNFLENHKGTSLSSPPSCSDLVAKRCFQIYDSENGDKNSKQESGHRATGEYVKADSSVSLNLVVCRTLIPIISGARDEAMSCKRRRTDTIPLPLLLKAAGSVDRQHPKSEVLEFSSSSIEDLDLELRLGDGPKVK